MKDPSTIRSHTWVGPRFGLVDPCADPDLELCRSDRRDPRTNPAHSVRHTGPGDHRWRQAVGSA